VKAKLSCENCSHVLVCVYSNNLKRKVEEFLAELNCYPTPPGEVEVIIRCAHQIEKEVKP